MSFLATALRGLAGVYSTWVASSAANDAAQVPSFQGPVATPEMESTAPSLLTPAEKYLASQKAFLAQQVPLPIALLRSRQSARTPRPIPLLQQAAGAYLQPKPVFANVPLAAAALKVADPIVVTVSAKVSAKQVENLFEVEATEPAVLGVIRLAPVMVEPTPEVTAVREAIAAGDVPALVAASTVVFEKLQVAHTELVASGVAVADIPSQAEISDLQAVVTNSHDPVGLLTFARMVSNMSAAEQEKLTQTLTTAGLGPRFSYLAEDLANYMQGLVEAAKEAHVDAHWVAGLEARVERLVYLQGDLPIIDLKADFALKFFQFSVDEVARITENSMPAEKARVERQFALMNILGMMALQRYLPAFIARDAAFLILRGFVGLSDQVDRSPRPDADLVGGMDSDRVAPVGNSPQAGDDGREASN